MADDRLTHWQKVYQDKAPEAVSWYQPVPTGSLQLVKATGADSSAPILDVGGGASTLVDRLLDEGFTDVSVLDLAAAALENSRGRLGARGAEVTWIVGDVLTFRHDRRFAIWHDRAVLHFLTDAADQERYVASLQASVQRSGHVILATFGPDGPTACSGLPVERYSAESLGALLGEGFTLRATHLDTHHTPAGRAQQFMYGWWQADAG